MKPTFKKKTKSLFWVNFDSDYSCNKCNKTSFFSYSPYPSIKFLSIYTNTIVKTIFITRYFIKYDNLIKKK